LNDVLWVKESGRWQAICPKHHLRLNLEINNLNNCCLSCGEGEHYFFSREFNSQLRYVQDKVDAKKFQKYKYINIDGEYTPIAEAEVKSKDRNFFVHAVLTDSKVGLRMVVYAGEKGKEKTQIFVEPDIKRLSFDQSNTHPKDVFLKLEGVFDDGSKATIERKINE